MLGPTRWLLVLLALLAWVTAGCGEDGYSSDPSAGGSSPAPTTAADRLSGDLKVSAAASLTEAFTEMGEAFEAEHPGVKVTFNFAASSALARQINEGSPADVLVSADESSMKKVADTGNAAHPRTIARNRLAILVDRANPKGITGLVDLGRSDLVFVVCAPEVPCGRLGAAALAKANVTAKPASLEANVKAVVSKVALGEADAGIVYLTDVKAAGDKAQGVEIDSASEVALEAVYPMAVTKTSANKAAATAWVEYVLSDDGQKTLASYGFLSP